MSATKRPKAQSRTAPKRTSGSIRKPGVFRLRGLLVITVVVAAVFGGGFGLGIWIAGPQPAEVETVVSANPSQTEAGSGPEPKPVQKPGQKPARTSDAGASHSATERPRLTPDLPRVTTSGTATSGSTATASAEKAAGQAAGIPSASVATVSVESAESLGAPLAPSVDAVWRKHAVAAVEARGRPMIAIVLDDLGVDRRRSARAIDLPAPLTLAFLPYATDVAAQAARATERGHELLVHLPMQPHGADVDPGPYALDMDLGAIEVLSRVEWNLARFPNFVGINNHMGSRFTESAEGTRLVAETARDRGVMLLDSLTSPRSVLADQGRAAGVPTVERDVFLDNTDSVEEVRKRLAQTEQVALARGTAVAIGHPRDATVEVLGPWIADVQARGFVLVPLTQVLEARMSTEVVSAAETEQ
jgi:hypothetical protein